jgi:Spy/CpxP family protein refolding chaperone
MRLTIALLISATGLFAQMQMPGGMPGGRGYQPTYDDVKATLGLTDDQLAQLKQLQTDKMAATQAFYGKMSEKQKELNQLLESNSADAAQIGKLMLELQQLRKQPAPGGTDIHEKAVAILSPEQKMKLGKLEDALKMRGAADQATQLALLTPPPPAPRQPAGGMPMMTKPAESPKK